MPPTLLIALLVCTAARVRRRLRREKTDFPLQVYGTAWRRCGIDSMIVPTTQKFMINHLGFFYVLKYPHKDRGEGLGRV